MNEIPTNCKVEGLRTTHIPVQTAEFHDCGMWMRKEQVE
jgi:hypothetical protein